MSENNTHQVETDANYAYECLVMAQENVNHLRSMLVAAEDRERDAQVEFEEAYKAKYDATGECYHTVGVDKYDKCVTCGSHMMALD